MTIIEEVRLKHRKLTALLEAARLDGVLLSRRCNFSWFTSGAYNHVNTATEAGAASLLVTARGVTVLTTNIEAERLSRDERTGLVALLGAEGDAVKFELSAYPWHDAEARVRAFDSAVAGRIVAADAPVAGVPTQPLPAGFDELRVCLLDGEVERYRRAARDVAEAIETAARGVQRGNTEYEIAGLMQAMLMQRNCLPWVTLVAGDARASLFRHPLPTAAPVKKYAMMVTCAERSGLVVACTRFFHFGKLPRELERKCRAVATVDAAMIDATRAGATLGGVLATGIDAYAAAGFADEWRLHHQGGSCGYLPREVIATPGSLVAIRENQAFAWNPSITGTKSEDTILCTPDEPEVLSVTDDWPMLDIEVHGRLYRRPAMLVR